MKEPSRWRVMVGLVRLLRPSWRWVAVAMAFAALTIVFGIGLMVTSTWLLAKASLHPSIGELRVAIVGVRFFGIFRAVFRYGDRYFSHEVTFRLLAQLRLWFCRGLVPLVPFRSVELRSGDLLTRLVADVDSLENFYVRVLSPPVVSLLVLGAATLTVGLLHQGFALIVALSFVLPALGFSALALALNNVWGRQRIALRAELNTRIADLVQGLPEVLAFGREGFFRVAIAGESAAHDRALEKLVLVRSILGMLLTLAGTLGSLGLLGFGLVLVARGDLDPLLLGPLAIGGLALLEAQGAFPAFVEHAESSLSAGRRVFGLVAHGPERVAGRSDLILTRAPELTCERVTFRYDAASAAVLEDFSASFSAGNVNVLLGPSGAGKSTLLALLVRLREGFSGHIRMDGEDLAGIEPEVLRAQVALLSQREHVFAGTLWENLTLGRPDATREEAVAALRRARAFDFVQALPDGFDTWLGDHGARLSGGERQRLVLARAFLSDARVLLLDEPTRSLDEGLAEDVCAEILSNPKRQTIIVATHDLRFLRGIPLVRASEGTLSVFSRSS